MEEKISVILPTYNQEKTIGRAIDSILNQKCHLPIEIIIGEDGSTDSTRAVCEAYAHRYPHIVRLMPKAPNKGITNNYYDCMLACHGKYIADSAGDDFWTDREKLEKELQIMEQHPDVTLVHTNWRYYEEDTQRTFPNTYTPFPAPITEGRLMLEAILTQTKAPVVHTCTAMYRADVMRRCYNAEPQLFRDPENGCEDMQLVFMLAMNGNIAYLPDVTLNYSIGHNSVSCQPDDRRQFRFVRRTASLSFSLAQRYGIKSDATRHFFSAKAFALLMHAFRSHSPQLRDEAVHCISGWNVRKDIKIKTALVIMSGSLSWYSALTARALFVAAKLLANVFKQIR